MSEVVERPGFADRLGRAKVAATVAMTIKARELRAAGHDVIQLTIGEPDFHSPRHAIEAAYAAALDGQTKYPPQDGTKALKEAVQRKFKRDRNLDYALDEIMVSNGGKQAIYNAYMATLNEGDEVVIGAMATHYDVLNSPEVAEHAALLALTAATVADPSIRHRGTLGGALSHADPAGDLGAPVLALDAQLVIASPGGSTRTVAVADFFQDYFTTAVEPGELLTQIRIPKHTGWGAQYEKFNRVAQAWSIVAVAAALKIDGGTVTEAKVALTNMASTPVRASGVEAALVGQPATAESFRAAAEHAAEGTNPGSDIGADAEYRTHLAGVLTRRALATAAGTVA